MALVSWLAWYQSVLSHPHTCFRTFCCVSGQSYWHNIRKCFCLYFLCTNLISSVHLSSTVLLGKVASSWVFSLSSGKQTDSTNSDSTPQSLGSWLAMVNIKSKRGEFLHQNVMPQPRVYTGELPWQASTLALIACSMLAPCLAACPSPPTWPAGWRGLGSWTGQHQKLYSQRPEQKVSMFLFYMWVVCHAVHPPIQCTFCVIMCGLRFSHTLMTVMCMELVHIMHVHSLRLTLQCHAFI